MILKYIKMWIEKNFYYKNIKLSKKHHVFIFLAADYGNVGDIAITCAQEEFLKKNYPTFDIVKIPLKDTCRYYKSIKKQITPDDIITIIGGGNMGDLYYGFELKRQFIIKNFKENKIISFPQTIYFTDTRLGKKIALKCQTIYSKHPNLTITARESQSYQIMKQMFKNNSIILTPDIVFSYNFSKKMKRKNITLCLRTDKEKNLNDDVKNKLTKAIYDNFTNIKEIDTHVGDMNIIGKEKEILHKKLTEFSKSKVVITDRLHGMIFCAITATPCIVLSNNNYKIEKTYNDWLKNISWITFYKDVNIDKIIKKIEFYSKESEHEPINYENKFLPLVKESSDI